MIWNFLQSLNSTIQFKKTAYITISQRKATQNLFTKFLGTGEMKLTKNNLIADTWRFQGLLKCD